VRVAGRTHCSLFHEREIFSCDAIDDKRKRLTMGDWWGWEIFRAMAAPRRDGRVFPRSGNFRHCITRWGKEGRKEGRVEGDEEDG